MESTVGHSAEGWRDVLDPGIARYSRRDFGGRFFWADASYAIPAIYERMEDAWYVYAIRLSANNVLCEKIAHRLSDLSRSAKSTQNFYQKARSAYLVL